MMFRYVKSLVGFFAVLVPMMVTAVETVSFPNLGIVPSIIDGDLADECWKKAYSTGPFKSARAGMPVVEKTEAWFFLNGETLYVAAKMDFRDYALREKMLSAAKHARSGFSGDCIELFIDPGDTGNYAHIGVNVAGNISANGLAAPIRFAVQLHEHDWTFEAAIPFASIKLLADRYNADWRINIARGNYKVGEDSSWSDIDDDAFHDRERFNRVKGIAADLVALAKLQKFRSRKDFEVAFDRMVYAGQRTAKGTVDLLSEKSLKGFRTVCTIRDEKGRAIAEKRVSPIAFHIDFEFPLTDFPDGQYAAEFELVDASGKAVRRETCNFWKIPTMDAAENPHRMTIRNHCTYRDGKFFFPIITWHFVARGDFKSREELIRATEAELAEMKDCGFNAVISQMHCFPEEDEDALKRVGSFQKVTYLHKGFRMGKEYGLSFADYSRLARKYGISVIVQSPYITDKPTPYSIGRFVDHVARLRKNPDILCWHTTDEQDGRVELNQLLNRLYHEVDGTRPTWINVINSVAQNKDAADILATDPYPIPGGRVTSVAAHGDRLILNAEGHPERGRWLWIQNFAGEGSWTRPPTPAEVRCMTMLAVNHGVNGIAYFNWFDPARRDGVHQHKDGTKMYPEFNAHLQKWAPALCQGEVAFRGRQGDLDVLAVTHEGRKVVSVVNVENKPVTDAEVKVDGFGSVKVSLAGYGTKVIEL